MASRDAASVRSRYASPPSEPVLAPAPSFGELLRYWRTLRHSSQLALALATEVSARHLSFLETGRARPSAEMVARLAQSLGLPLRERNALFLAAGFAPPHDQRALEAPELTSARRAIQFILDKQEPYPAFVLSRHWDVVMRNRASARVFGWLLRGRRRDANIMRQVFATDGLRPLIVNWDDVARDMLQHLHSQVLHTPTDEAAAALLREILASPNAPARAGELSRAPGPLLTAMYARDGTELRFFSTLSTFGTPHAVTLEELQIECTFPADDATDRFCRELARADP